MAKAFMRVDENADGFISKHEMMNLLNRFHLSMTDEHFQQYVSQVFFKTPVSQPLFRLKKKLAKFFCHPISSLQSQQLNATVTYFLCATVACLYPVNSVSAKGPAPWGGGGGVQIFLAK